jgi:hypothetical protein
MLIHAPCRCWKRRDSQAFDFVVASEESSTSGFGARSRTRPIGSTTFGSCCSSSNQKRLLRLPCPTRVAANIDAAHGDAGRATDPLRHSNTRLKNSWPSNRGNGGEPTNVRALCGQMPDVTLSSAPGRFKPLKTARVTMFGHTLFRAEGDMSALSSRTTVSNSHSSSFATATAAGGCSPPRSDVPGDDFGAFGRLASMRCVRLRAASSVALSRERIGPLLAHRI